MSTTMNNNPKPPKYVVRRYKLSASINKTKTNGSDLDDGSSSTPSSPTSVATVGLPTIHEDEEAIHEDPIHESSVYVHEGPIFVYEEDEKPSSLTSSTTNTTNTIIHHPVHKDLSPTSTSTGTGTTNTTTPNPPTANSCHMTSAFVLMEQHGIDIDTVTNDQWDEIIWYQVAVVRKQRREKRRGGHKTHCGEIFSVAGEENRDEKKEKK